MDINSPLYVMRATLNFFLLKNYFLYIFFFNLVGIFQQITKNESYIMFASPLHFLIFYVFIFVSLVFLCLKEIMIKFAYKILLNMLLLLCLVFCLFIFYVLVYCIMICNYITSLPLVLSFYLDFVYCRYMMMKSIETLFFI